MGRPENGACIVQGEVNLVVIAMRRNSRWSSRTHQDGEQDPLLNSFSQLKDVLNSISSLQELAPNEFLSPFLEVIRSEDTTGPITGLALTSVNKFLSYGLIDPNSSTAAAAIENIADAVTHARFVGTDPSNDEVVLMKILHVLRTLLLTAAGAMLTNESVCEIMQSCFRICFEMRLSELLRKSAEHTLMDMVQLLFSRLPHFKEDPKWATSLKKLKMRTGGIEQARGGRLRKRSPKPKGRKGKSHSQAAAVLTHSQNYSEPVEHPKKTVEFAPQIETKDGCERSSDTQPASEDPRQQDLPLEYDQVARDIITQEKGQVESRPDYGYVVSGTDKPSPRVPTDLLPTPPESNLTSPVEEPVTTSVTIATTPTAGNRTLVDIQQGFKDSDSDGRDQTDVERTSISLDIADSYIGRQSPDRSHTLQVPSSDDMQRADSEQDLRVEVSRVSMDGGEDGESTHSATDMSESTAPHDTEYVNPRGVRFMQHHQHGRDGSGPLIPYGLPCVRELFRFLVSLTNPLDRHNTDVMVHMGLSLLTVALEAGADHIASFSSLLCLVRDDMCKNLFFLMQSERLSLFAASLRVCFLLFESMRSHLKFQLEMYLTRLMEIIVSESTRISYEQCEVALESVVQILRIPGLVTELYLNYDCDLYCTNLFEDLMKLLSKNAFPVKGLFTTNLLSLDALLAVIDSIEQHCHHRVLHTNKKHADSPTMNRRKSPEGMVEGAPDEEFTVPPTPPPSGYVVADKMQASQDSTTGGTKNKSAEVRSGPRIRPNRMKVCGNMPCEEELAAIKHKKKLYHTGSEQFNMKPTKGIAFLQEHGLLTDPLDAGEIVVFLKENPKLDKKQIGEFISARKNMTVLEAFQKSFNFEDARIDEALRMYLESFRLPGEAPVISYLLEHFADHWHKMNNEPFANTDAAFTLAYAVLMLNTDQHNTNAKKQNIPMTSEDFKRNLRKVNGGQDFDEDMLEEIFCAIKSDEIVMPSEQVGIVKENYLWKMLIRRGNSKDGDFLHAPTGAFDRDLFALVWGPTVAALSFVFDKSVDETIIQKAISGFRKCAMISAHYGISDVFDNLIISLCKFTTLLSTAESAEAIPVSFGNNQKAQLSARTMFALAHRHGDILREGWKNILDCMLQLFRAKLLPESLVKVDDFIDPSGKISLIQEKNAAIQRAEPGVLSSLYSLFSLTETPQQRGPTPEEQEASRRAAKCIDECHVEQLIQESKFLRVDSLHDLIKALIFQSQSLEAQESLNGQTRCDDESPVFFLELLIKVILQNRDRIGPFWQIIRAHFYSLIVHVPKKTTLVERAVVGLLTLAKRLLCREDLAPQVLESLRILLMMEKNVIHDISRQVAYGLHDLLKGNAANIHSKADWYTLFTLLEVTGAGTSPVPFQPAEGSLPPPAQDAASESGAQSDSEVMSTSTQGRPEDTGRGYTSDSELYESASRHGSKTHAAEPSETRPDITVKPLPDKDGSWVLQNDHVEAKTDNSTLQVYNKDKQATTPPDDRDALTTSSRILKRNQFSIDLNEELTRHDPKALTKSCETLAFLVRDAAHVTPHNFESCVHAIRTFVEAGLNGGRPIKPKQVPERKEKHHRKKTESQMNRSRSSPSHLSNLPDSDEEGKEADGYHSLSIQLLDLMHTLHTRAATIFSSWAEEDKIRQEETYSDEATGIDAATSTLWTKCWCPLLQGIACLCCDSRRQVRSQALTYLQKALLVHDLQTLSAFEWESCFNKVLFPLLSKLLENINTQDPSGIEETRMRASALLCKVFLQHLTPLLQLSTFTALWLTILEFMDKYMHADRSDLLCEAIPESLKNMLLVMHTAGILQNGGTEESQLWKLTWDRIDTFLPKLREEVFKPHELEHRRSIPRQEPAVQAHTSTGPSENPAPVTTQSEPPETVAHQYTQPPETVAHQYSQQQQYAQQQYAQQAYQYDQQQHAATAQAQQQPSSAVPVHGTGASEASESSAGESRTSESYLTSTGAPSQAQYVLHPPLPSGLGVPGAGGGTVPLLLDPNIIQGANIPILSPQNTTEANQVSGHMETK